MKVLLVGTGSVGSVIAQQLAKEKSIESLTLGDLNVVRAEALAGSSKGEKVRGLKLDASNHDELRNAIKGKDLVVNSSHPNFNETIMKLCLKLGVNYVDLANRSIKGQLSHDRQWKQAKLLAVVGLGEDPGLSNLYARYAADRLDRVNEIRIRDGEYSVTKNNRFAPLFSPVVFFEEILTPALIYEDGKLKKVPPLSSKEEYEFPPPIGKQTLYALDHEEVETLPLYIKKGVRYVDFKLALSEEFVTAMEFLRNVGMLSKKAIEFDGSKIAPFDVFVRTFPTPVSVAQGIRGYAGLQVEVNGAVGGRSVSFVVGTQMSHEAAFETFKANATSFLTGIVPAVVISKIAEEKIGERGVIPAEGLDPRPILKRLDSLGVHTQITRIEHN
jgi:saccharopine dehydrogenase (NAD+, L-lysine-forming)